MLPAGEATPIPPHLHRKAALAQASSRLLVSACALVFLLGGLAVYVRTDKSEQSLQILQNCTIPGHSCYDDAHRSTDVAVSTINKVSILAAYCAKQPQLRTVAAIHTCVLNHLK